VSDTLDLVAGDSFRKIVLEMYDEDTNGPANLSSFSAALLQASSRDIPAVIAVGGTIDPVLATVTFDAVGGEIDAADLGRRRSATFTAVVRFTSGSIYGYSRNLYIKFTKPLP